jgi:hypothetical protein
MKKLLLIPVLLATLTLGLAFSVNRATADGGDNPKRIVGAWEVNAEGAQYEPHLFTFHADGTMLTTNPTNVQEDPSAPHGGTNDSVGMGVWDVVTEGGQKYVVGTFEQLNAFADDHTEAPKLSVTFKVTVNGDTFAGPAWATVGSGEGEATLTGERIVIDEETLEEHL